MANTLFMYEGEHAQRVACMMSSIVCMGRYVKIGSNISMTPYARLVLVIEESDLANPGLLTLPEKHPQWLGLVLVGETPEKMMNIPDLGEFSFTAFVDRKVLDQDAIVAGEGLARAVRTKHTNDPEVLKAIEDFLHHHNTGALATGWGEAVHSTPIEYIYHQGKLYIFSEGGRKFAYLYRNRHVSMSIFDPFTGFKTIAGLQLDGTVRFIEPGDAEYDGIAAARGIAKERLDKMAVMLHVIEITPHKAHFLWGEFGKRGKAPTQVYTFPGSPREQDGE